MNSDVKQAYLEPVLWAILLHMLVLAFLIFQLTMPVRSSSAEASSTPIVQAVAVSQQAVDQYEQAIVQQQQAKQAAQQAAQQAILQKQLQAQREAQLKAQLIQQQLLHQQQLQQQQAAQAVAAAKAQVVAKAAAAAKVKQQQVVKQVKQQLMQQMQSELASDQTQQNQNAAQANQALGEVNKYKALIIQAISQQWIMPQNLANNISCLLDIRVAPGGTVIDVTVSQSSGNPVFDNSAIAAVNKASPLPVPTDPGLFDQFRELHLTVKPDGSMTSS